MVDVAREAGCSTAAVSKALRNSHDISLTKRKEIQEIAKKMGYAPNPLVSALLANRSNGRKCPRCIDTIAMLNEWPIKSHKCEWRNNSNINGQIDGIYSRANELGYKIEPFSFDEGKISPNRLNCILHSRGIRGIIILPSPSYNNFLNIPTEHFAIAAIGSRDPIHHFHHVSTNRFDDILMILNTIYKKGYINPGLVMSIGMDEVTNHQYYGGYLAYHSTIKPNKNHNIFFFDNFGSSKFNNTIDSFKKWINNIDIIIGDVSFHSLLLDLGIKIPTDIAFAGINIRSHHNNISGLRNHMKEVGAAAVDLVASQLYRNEFGVPANPKTVLINGRWIDGFTA